MLRNLFLVSYRNLRQNRSYTFLHVLGLTLGMTCALFITLYLVDEMSYDNFHVKKDRIQRIVTAIEEGGTENHYPSTQIPFADELKSKYTVVEDAVRFIRVGRELFEVPSRDLKFYEEKMYFTDPSVFEVFSFPLIDGDVTTALSRPYTAVITEATAQRYFGTADAINKTFTSKGRTYSVTAIARNVPRNSSIQFDALLSITSFPLEKGDWTGWYPDTYVLVAADKTLSDVEAALASINKEHVMPKFQGAGMTIRYWLQPITDIHLKSGVFEEGGDAIEYVYIFMAIAVFVILIVCINYINLATARATRRAKEIGIRKTIGSTKGNIILQFVAESLLLTVASLIFSVALTFTLLPVFNQVAGKSIDISFLAQPSIVIAGLLLVIFIGVVGGSYPAFYLSRFNPALVLKGNISRGNASARLRKVLVSVQFAISIAMIICTSVVYDQLNFMRNKDLGFNKDQVIHIELADSATMASTLVLSDRLKSYSKVLEVASSSSMPGRGINYSVMRVENNDGYKSQGVFYHDADYDFVQTIGLTVVQGRNFSRDLASDSTAALVNESMVKSMNWKEPIGKRFYYDDGNPGTVDRYFTVVGVVKDYHQSSLHSPITALTIFRNQPNYFLNIKIDADDIRGTLGFITKTWNDITDGKPFTYSFLDANFEAQYAADEKRGQIFTVFSVACLIISCVGLFGLAAYTTEQRSKEISIRKVVGATIPAIVKLFYSDFLKLIVIGMIVAFPTSYFVMDNWLETFAYQSGMSWIDFVGSAAITMLITMGSISFYAIRAATINPAKILKSE
jgi:putative ABC transport system permease protein